MGLRKELCCEREKQMYDPVICFVSDATVPTPIATATPTDVSLVNSPSSSCPPTPAPCDVTAAQSKGQEKSRRRPSNTSSATSGVASESKARRINMKSHLMTRKFKKALAGILSFHFNCPSRLLDKNILFA